MFGLGFTEIIFLSILALIVIGPEDLPKLARTIGRFLNEIKRGSESFRREIVNNDLDFKQQLHDIAKDIKPNLKIDTKNDVQNAGGSPKPNQDANLTKKTTENKPAGES